MYVMCKDGMPHEESRMFFHDAVTDLKRAYSYYSRQERVISMTDIEDNMFGIECMGGSKHTFSIYEI